MSTQTDRGVPRRRARRAALITMMALGGVISLTAVNGVFAVFTDRATTGTNSTSSRAEARSADIQIAEGTLDTSDNSFACGTYSEDLVTGIITATDMIPLGPGVRGFVCLKNVGSRTVDLTVSVIDLVDTDHACTGDEGALDATCGGDEPGELSAYLTTGVFEYDCIGGGTTVGNANIAAMASTPFVLPSIATDSVRCFEFAVSDQAQNTGDGITTSQSDTATWKFAFDATAV